jgi:hypothetical protein
MNALTQHIIVLAIVAAAAVYLARIAWATLQSKSNCGCAKGGCPRVADMNRKLRAPR